jgi:2-polyprenyl-6-hydroxyphenyl methylase/3-demethylubiquinone-9 3-methyltransferase
MEDEYHDYGFHNPLESHMHRHFLPKLLELSGAYLKPGARVLDVGCGNGFTAGEFLRRGCDVVGIDLSRTGIEVARKAFPGGRFEILPGDDRILENLGCEPFDLVVSTEVIEHLYAPRAYVAGCFHALRSGGRFVCSTPYHGYLKNLAIALAGRTIAHATPLWDGGHIKLWDRQTLSHLLKETGFINLQFRGAGRLPFLWMTMLMSGDRPSISARQ